MSSLGASTHQLEGLITITSTSNRSDLNIKNRAFQLVLEKSYIVVTTLVASTAQPVLQILNGSTELATVTLDPAQAKDDLLFFTPASGIAPIIRLASNTVTGIKVKTAANGGSPAGVVRGYLHIQYPEATS